MDLSHMIGLWLVGQEVGEMPRGVGVVYAPIDADNRDEMQAYPFSAERLVLRHENPRLSSEQTGLELGALCVGMGLVGELEYDAEGLAGFVPRLFSAVSMARGSTGGSADGPHAEGVNRGVESIGLSDALPFVDRFDESGVLGRARVVGFVERPTAKADASPVIEQASADAAVADFPVMFEKLSDYLRFQVGAQVEGNGYEDLAGVLAKSDRPAHAVVIAGLSHGVAAARQSRGLEDSGGLEVGDICHSVVYDSAVVSLGDVRAALEAGRGEEVLSVEGVSWLKQVVV